MHVWFTWFPRIFLFLFLWVGDRLQKLGQFRYFLNFQKMWFCYRNQEMSCNHVFWKFWDAGTPEEGCLCLQEAGIRFCIEIKAPQSPGVALSWGSCCCLPPAHTLKGNPWAGVSQPIGEPLYQRIQHFLWNYLTLTFDIEPTLSISRAYMWVPLLGICGSTCDFSDFTGVSIPHNNLLLCAVLHTPVYPSAGIVITSQTSFAKHITFRDDN